MAFKPIRPMGEKELKILSDAVEREGKKLGVKTILVPFSADLLLDEDPSNEDPETKETENVENVTENETKETETEEIDTDPGKELTEEEIRAKGKELKIPSAHNKNLDKLKDEIRAIEDTKK